MKKIFLFVLLLTSSTALPMTFPQIVAGNGTECVILVSNKSDSTWRSDFLVRQGNQQLWGGPLWVNGIDIAGSEGFWVELPPLASLKIRLVGGSQLQAGYIELDTDMSSSTLDVAVSFFYNFRDSQGNLMDSVSIPPSMFAGTEFLLPVERSASVDTGFAWCPGLLGGPFDVEVTLYREDGTVFQTKTVDFSGHAAQFFYQIFDNVPAEFLGMMRINAQNLFHIAVLRIEYTNSGFQYAGTAPDDFIP